MFSNSSKDWSIVKLSKYSFLFIRPTYQKYIFCQDDNLYFLCICFIKNPIFNVLRGNRRSIPVVFISTYFIYVVKIFPSIFVSQNFPCFNSSYFVLRASYFNTVLSNTI